MKTYFYRAFVVLAIACASASSCNFINETQGEEMLVIDALVISGGFPRVTLTRSIPTGKDKEIMLSSIVLRWATVEISDGNNTYTMTGRFEPESFPPFVYNTFELRGKPGTSYTITVVDKDLKLTAKATVPEISPVIEKVALEPLSSSDSLVHCSMRFALPESADTLHVMAWVCDKRCDGSAFYPGFMSMMKTCGGNNLIIPINRGKHRDDMEHFSPNFKLGDEVNVILGVVDKNVYEYWERFQNNVYFSGGAFLAPSAIGADKVNVVGEGLGAFSAVGADCVSFMVNL